MDDKLKGMISKKFFAFLLVVVVVAVLVFVGKIGDAVLQNVLTFVAPLYFASDATQNIFKDKNDKDSD